MKTMKFKARNFILDLFFPKYCFSCQREGSYLCQDCRATLEISSIHQRQKTKYLSDLYCSCDYQNPLVKRLVQQFKYQPLVKELAKPLSFLIISHLQLIEKQSDFPDFLLISVPLEKSKLKWRGFNQAEEIGQNLSSFLKIPLITNVLIKIKSTLPQVELSEKERKENVKGVFSAKDNSLVKNKKILLIDDVYTTGSTMEESARVLKEAGVKEVIGIVVARAKPEGDRFQNI